VRSGRGLRGGGVGEGPDRDVAHQPGLAREGAKAAKGDAGGARGHESPAGLEAGRVRALLALELGGLLGGAGVEADLDVGADGREAQARALGRRGGEGERGSVLAST